MAGAKPQKKKPDDGGAIKLVTENRRARHHYAIEDTVEAGLVLTGSEVKALREGTANLSDSYVIAQKGEFFLLSAHIGTYRQASVFSHEPTRMRKVLMHRQEIERWETKVKERGYSIIPMSLYFKGGKAKVQLALCKGKTHEDRRQIIAERDSRREIDRELRRKGR
jgi:SsrA-binding protein